MFTVQSPTGRKAVESTTKRKAHSRKKKAESKGVHNND